MKIRSLLFALCAVVALAFGNRAHAGPQDTADHAPQYVIQDSTSLVNLVAQATDQTQVQDSIEASDPVLVPFAKEIRAVARKRGVPPALLAAFIQEESRFDEWAHRTEPGYLKKKNILAQARVWSKRHHGIPTAVTEQYDRSTSIGLMQVMGQVAREQGYDSLYLATLYEPMNAIDQGAIHLKQKIRTYAVPKGAAGPDTLAAISAYNQGDARKKFGRFQNARYVYRVAIAWEAYDRIFKTNSRTIHENRFEQNPAGPSLRGPAFDRAEALHGPSLVRDTAAGAIGIGALQNGSRHNDRHDPPSSGPTIGAGDEPLRTDSRPDDAGRSFAVIVGASTLLAVGLYAAAGYVSDRRIVGDRAGHDRDSLRPSDRFVLAKSQTQPTNSTSTPYTRRAGLRDTRIGGAGMARRRTDRA